MGKSKSLLKTSAAALGILHCINKAIDSTSIVNTTTKSTGKYYHWKHGDIFYHVAGSGKPLLLIHDLTVFSSSYEWTKMADQLSDTYTVYSLDLIGCGKSDKPAITYTNYFYVQMITDFVNDIIKEKTNVAATGLSGSFVLMANEMNKNLFAEIMLVNPKSIHFLKKTPDDRSKILLRLFDLPIIGKTAYYIATNKTNTEYYLTEKCFYNPFHMKHSVFKAYYDAAHASNGNGKALLASIEGNYLNIDISKALKNAKNRIVIVNGICNDNREDIVASYVRLNKHIVVENISEAKYLPQLEAADEMLELMYTF